MRPRSGRRGLWTPQRRQDPVRASPAGGPAHVVAQALRHRDCSAASLSPYARTVSPTACATTWPSRRWSSADPEPVLNASGCAPLQVPPPRPCPTPATAGSRAGPLPVLPRATCVAPGPLAAWSRPRACSTPAASSTARSGLVRDSLGIRADTLASLAGLAPRGGGARLRRRADADRTPRPRHTLAIRPPRLRDRTPRGPPPVIPAAGRPMTPSSSPACCRRRRRDVLAELEQLFARRRQTGYGPLYDLLADYPFREGKGLRPASASRAAGRSAARTSRRSCRPAPSSSSTTRSSSTTTSRRLGVPAAATMLEEHGAPVAVNVATPRTSSR